MHIISKKDKNEWLYLAEVNNKNDIELKENDLYYWTKSLTLAKIFQSPEEARIFWKVIKDKLLNPKYSNNDSELGIRKIIFKKEKVSI